MPEIIPTRDEYVSDPIDERTGRAPGDHGTAMRAIEYALDVVEPDGTASFLEHWREGDLDEWPEFYAWLRELGE